MRKILKALSLVMVLVMCFTMVFTTAVSAEGTDTLVLSVDNAAPKAGETVNITVTSNFTTVAGAHFAIDLAGLEYVSVAGDYAEYFSAETMNFVKEFNEDNGNLVESGVLFVITATVPADAEAGTVYNVGFGTINASKEFCDYDLNEVVVTKTGVDVTVAAAHTCVYGDLQYKVEDGNCITYKACECGEEVVVATVANINVENALVLASGLAIRFRVLNSDLGDYINGNVYASINHDLYSDDTTISGTTDAVEIAPVAAGTTSKPKLQFTYEGLAAKEMLSAIHVKIFSSDAEGNVILVASSDFVIADYLKTNYINKSTTSAAYKTLAADMLRYGAESQKAFDYRANVLPNEGVDSSYFSELPTTFENTTATPSNAINLESATVLGNTITFRFRFLKTAVAAYDINNLKYTVDYKDSSGNTQTWPTDDDADEAVISLNSTGKKYQFDFAKMPVASVNDYMTVRLWDGETEIGTLEYSFQCYAASAVANSSNPYGTLCQAICAYSTSAATAFGG